MTYSLRFGPALSAIAMATVIAGCAAPQSGARSASIFGGKVDKSNIGLATRALVALNANDYATAVNLAERAVENSPKDAGFRALLGNAYFGSGRFASAESAYRDSLALVPTQPQVVLKLALVEIAQGRKAEALAFLASARGLLEPADFGLAVALAGRPQDAVNVLESAARETGADARVRQNLALAYAMTGDWTSARTIAAQDLSADLVDARIQQWMSFAKPVHAADQVAALTGVKPAAGDPGQPTRLALRPVNTRTAEVAPVVVPKPVKVVAPRSVAVVAPKPIAEVKAPVPIFAPPAVAFAPPPKPPVPVFAPPAVAFASPPIAAFAAPLVGQVQFPVSVFTPPVLAFEPEPQPVAEQSHAPQLAEVVAAPAPKPARAPVVPAPAPAPEPQAAVKIIAAAAAAAPDAPAAYAFMAAFTQRAQLRKQAKAAAARAAVRRASLPRRTGNSTAVMQLGAYGSPQRVANAWNAAARRFSMLRPYSPMSARFNSAKGLVYRLSVRGFGNADQAKNLCMSLRRSGGSCFVRTVAGDVPVRLASR